MISLMIVAPTATAAAPAPGIVESFLIPMALMFVVFYFLLIRPQQQQRKKHTEMISNIKRGDTVVTAGGIVAKVVKASDGDEVMVEIADGVQASVIRATITHVRSRTEPAEKAKA
ncbi:MAG: preprotein translocase subunit YajC [Pseudomonadota bacterium]